MSYKRIHNESHSSAMPVCVYLRSKAMYVTGDLEPAHLDEEGSHFCWCNLTQHVMGPDGRPINRARCTPGRDCYRRTR